jgi:hypothetical protein
VQRGEESPVADQFGDAVPSHIREKVGIDAPEDNANTLARKLFKQPADGLRRGEVYVGERFRVADARAPYSPQLPGERPTTSRLPCSTPAATTGKVGLSSPTTGFSVSQDMTVRACFRDVCAGPS